MERAKETHLKINSTNFYFYFSSPPTKHNSIKTQISAMTSQPNYILQKGYKMIARRAYATLSSSLSTSTSAETPIIHHSILVCGAGTAGLTVVSQLKRAFISEKRPLKDGSIGVIDPSKVHHCELNCVFFFFYLHFLVFCDVVREGCRELMKILFW